MSPLTGDNYNTMFEGNMFGFKCNEGSNIFASLKKMLEKKSLIGVGFLAHILNNCVHHRGEIMYSDIENINKIYQYFHIYTDHTEQLK